MLFTSVNTEGVGQGNPADPLQQFSLLALNLFFPKSHLQIHFFELLIWYMKLFKSSCVEVSYNKGILRNLVKFTGKHLCQRLFFNKVASLRYATLSEKVLAQVFFCEFCEISKNIFFTEHFWWMLLALFSQS